MSRDSAGGITDSAGVDGAWAPRPAACLLVAPGPVNLRKSPHQTYLDSASILAHLRQLRLHHRVLQRGLEPQCRWPGAVRPRPSRQATTTDANDRASSTSVMENNGNASMVRSHLLLNRNILDPGATRRWPRCNILDPGATRRWPRCNILDPGATRRWPRF
jgi:hypothetical protein